jgi:hypothetical protein
VCRPYRKGGGLGLEEENVLRFQPWIEGTLVLRSAVEKMTFELNRQARDAMVNIPARGSGILAATSDQSELFRLLTQEIVQAMEGLAGGPGA